MHLQSRMLFTLAVVGFSAYTVISSRDWPLGTRLFPWIVGIPIVFLSLIQLVVELYQSRSATDRPKEDTGDLQVDLSMGARIVAEKAGNFFAWLLGFFFCIWILGFFLAVPLYTFLNLKFQAKESWLLSSALTLGAFVFLVVLFDQTIHIAWHQPLISSPEELIRSLIPQLPEFE